MNNIEIVTQRDGTRYIVLRAEEGQYETEDYEILIAKKTDPVQAAIERLEDRSPDQYFDEAEPQGEPNGGGLRTMSTEFRGYTLVKVSSNSQDVKSTRTLHAAILYKDGSVSAALCDPHNRRTPRRVKRLTLEAVQCKRCAGHLKEYGVLTP